MANVNRMSGPRSRRVVSPSRVRACASARVGAHTRVGRDNETITERDNCLCLRLASRVCTLEAGSAVDVDIDDYGAWPVAQVHDARKVAYTCRRAGGNVHLHFALRVTWRYEWRTLGLWVRGRRSSRGSGQ